jgi:hypothetical protein
MRPIASSDIVFFMNFPFGAAELRRENSRWTDLAQQT